MKLEFRVPTKSDVDDILTWKYDGKYSFYDNDIQKEKMEWIESFVDSDDNFSIYNDSNKLVGNCSFYYIEEFICVGLQMKPELTGKGFGIEFAKAIVDFGREKYKLNYID
jgi:[ribosomal protein S18]-alanine N-acetyltransferase